ncbi:MAG: tetratricopeptide repeat protein [candidate division WOR-3 bacterium]|nr:MAG: tetratricopeptide repeat protein [candidate division WOR-3 bacterium]
MKILPAMLACLAAAWAQSIQNARMLERAGQPDKALDEYRAVLAREPGDIGAYNEFHRLSMELESYDSLLTLSTRLARMDPGRVEYQQGRIDGLFGTRQRREALSQVRLAVDAQPGLMMLYLGVLEHWGEFEQAIEYLQQARRAAGDSAFLAGRMAELYERDGRFVQAAGEVVRVVNQQPEALEGFLGKLSLYAGKVKLKPMLDEVEKIRDTRARARAQAEVYLVHGDWQKALKAVEPVFGDDGMYGFAREAEAREAWNVALRVYQDQELYADQARVLRIMGRDKEALAVLTKDQSVEAKFELAELFRIEQGELRSAVESYSEVLARRPQHEPSVYGLACAFVGLGETRKAEAVLQGLERKTDRVLLLLAEVALYRGNMDSVKSRTAELATRFPNSQLLNDGLGLALVAMAGQRVGILGEAMLSERQGRLGKAEEQYRVLLPGSDAVSEVAHFGLAGVLRGAGRSRDALLLLDDFAERFPASPRRAKALLEQAEIAGSELKDENKQREMLERLVVEYPGSSYAPIARSLLAETSLGVDPGGIR